MARRRILFVDDEPNVLEGLRRLLHDERDMWDLSFANNPRTAKNLLLDEPFDVVVLDVNMPGQDGVDLLVDIKSDERTREIEVILLTGIADENLKHEAIDLGAIDLLRKPVGKHELMARLRSALRIKGFRDELKEKNAALEREIIRSQKVELTGLLAAGAAQDLNNILTAIVGYTSLVRRRAAEQFDSREVAAMIAKMQQAGLRAAKIAQQIVNLAKNRPAESESFSLSSIIHECIEMLRLCVPRQIQIVFKDETRSSLIRTNSTEIHHVVMNLCMNAVQAMGDKGLLRIGLREIVLKTDNLQTYLADPGLELIVSDTGPGINPETLSQAFETCFRTKENNGCGLRLSVAQRIVENYGGRIDASSDPGKGTTCSVFLPIEREEA